MSRNTRQSNADRYREYGRDSAHSPHSRRDFAVEEPHVLLLRDEHHDKASAEKGRPSLEAGKRNSSFEEENAHRTSRLYSNAKTAPAVNPSTNAQTAPMSRPSGEVLYPGYKSANSRRHRSPQLMRERTPMMTTHPAKVSPPVRPNARGSSVERRTSTTGFVASRSIRLC